MRVCTLVSILCFGALCSSAWADSKPKANKVVLTLSDVDDRIAEIKLFACDFLPNTIIVDCPAKIRISLRDGRQFEKRVSHYTEELLRETRNSFSSDLHKISEKKRDKVCMKVPPQHAPRLQAQYIHYEDHDAFKIKKLENKTVLSDDDCSRDVVIQPEEEKSYEAAKKAAEVLKVVAVEYLETNPGDIRTGAAQGRVQKIEKSQATQ